MLGRMTLNGPRSPQCGVSIKQAAAGEMLRGCRRHLQSAKPERFPPVEFGDAVGSDAEGLAQVRGEREAVRNTMISKQCGK